MHWELKPRVLVNTNEDLVKILFPCTYTNVHTVTYTLYFVNHVRDLIKEPVCMCVFKASNWLLRVPWSDGHMSCMGVWPG